VSSSVTFLLTEVVDSVRRWEDDEARMGEATERLDDIVRDAVAQHRGVLVKPRGEGDSHFLTFDDPIDAVECAVTLQRALGSEALLPLRSSCHIGAAEMRDGDWYGTTVNRCARLRAAAHARQSLVSAEVVAAIGTRLRNDTSLRSLGRHRLKDLDDPAEIFQICAPGLVREHPPLATLLQSHGLDLPRSSVVGRAAESERVAAALHERGVVTVTGAPGVGTTRFALEAAARWWDQERLPVRVSEGRRAEGELVVVPDANADSVDAAFDGPMIVVARAPLGTAGEQIVRLEPLNDFDAVALFHDRLADDVHVPDALVAYCDGLPVAVELLARRAGAVDASELADRLAANPLTVLGGHRRAEPARHESMRSTFRAAFDALDDEVRAELLTDGAHSARLVAAGWHEPDGPLPLVARFIAEMRSSP
jgi:class 3 adenylate cyclase